MISANEFRGASVANAAMIAIPRLIQMKSKARMDNQSTESRAVMTEYLRRSALYRKRGFAGASVTVVAVDLRTWTLMACISVQANSMA